MKTQLEKFGIWSGVLASTAALALLEGCGAPERKVAVDTPPKTVYASVQEVRLIASATSVTAVGTIRAKFNSSLSSKVAGRVVSVYAHDGDSIRQGQILVQIDAGELQSAADTAQANYRASLVGVDSARTVAEMEVRTDAARIAQAKSQIQQAKSALASAEAKADLVRTGPRKQELAQSHIAVQQAESTMKLARVQRDRVATLVKQGAMAGKELDIAQNQFELSEGQYHNAVQAENMAIEGSRSQEIRSADEGVRQARAFLREAETGLVQAQAASLQIAVRRKQIDVAAAQSQEAQAAVRSAQVGLSYTQILAPFDGHVTQRMVDPGTMAGMGVPIMNVEGGEYRLEAVVPESALSAIHLGQSETVMVDALPSTPLKAKVAEIVPQADGATHSFMVRLSLGQPAGLHSGMYGKVRFMTGSKPRFLVPQTATWLREGLAYVYTVGSDGKAHLRIVTTGEKFGDQIEILSGLSQGDKLIVNHLQEVEEGAKVEADRS